MTTITTLLSGGEGVGLGARAAGLTKLDIAKMDELCYTGSCLDERTRGVLLLNAVIKHNAYCGQSAPYQVDSRPAVRLSNCGKLGKGRFVMPKISKVKHFFLGGVEGKECLRCNTWLSLAEYNTDNSKKDGLNIYCKKCRSEKRAIVASEFNAKRRQIYAISSEQIKQRNKSWRDVNKDKLNQTRKDIRAANPDKYRKQGREFYAKNREQIVNTTRQKRANNPSKHRQWNSRWNKQNPDKRKVQSQRRRAFINNVTGDHTSQEWEQVKAQYNYTCLRCYRIEPEIKLTVDHIIPLSLGGSNSIDNLQPLCIQCNSGKKDKAIDYRLQYRGKND